MTDNEIMKALDVCSSNGLCNECPFDILDEPGCYDKVKKAALDIIQRQQEELKKYKSKIAVLQGLVEVWKAVRKDDR